MGSNSRGIKKQKKNVDKLITQTKTMLDTVNLKAPPPKNLQTTSNNEKVMLKLKGVSPKERKSGAKGEKIVHGSLGILGLQTHTKSDD